MKREVHKAICGNCGYCAKTSGTGTFIKTLYLPDTCPTCECPMGSMRAAMLGAAWFHEISRQTWVAPKRTWNPVTWFAGSQWEETSYTIGAVRAVSLLDDA